MNARDDLSTVAAREAAYTRLVEALTVPDWVDIPYDEAADIACDVVWALVNKWADGYHLRAKPRD
ncbi:hypothetical protein [Actinacidiphila sp. bgisy160]|uniref:hypothetical protein n=1 Tax=Actinacidiphila sp. bgisy160 TaxID=3413796 RepID=UPI003D716725